MKTLLYVKSSVFGDKGQSSKLANRLIARWLADHPEGQVVERDLVNDPIPHYDLATISALSTAHEERTVDQHNRVTLSDTLIEELKHASAVVLAAPMYNFAVPSQLKAWFDQVARNGVTFRYTESGPVGLLQDKPVYVLATRGGQYHEVGLDYQVPWLTLILGFVGLRQVQVVLAEGLNMATAEESYKAAQSVIDQIQFN